MTFEPLGIVAETKIKNNGGWILFYINPNKKWWQFWKQDIKMMHLCPHKNGWDECPDCCH